MELMSPEKLGVWTAAWAILRMSNTPKTLPAYFRARMASLRLSEGQPPAPAGNDSEALMQLLTLKEYRLQAMAEVELAYLRQLHSLTKCDLAASCQMAGLAHSQLYALIKRHSLLSFKNG